MSTTWTKEERDEARKDAREDNESYRQHELHLETERNRREDLIREQDFWAGTFQMFIEKDAPYVVAVDMADKALASYKARFQ
jgi:hypothetical protein